MTNGDSIERLAVTFFEQLGWETTDCHNEVFGPGGTLGRETKGEVVLLERLRPALRLLNPGASEGDLTLAVEELVRDRDAMSLAEANREVHRLLRDGCPVLPSGGVGGRERAKTVRYLDWDDPGANDFLLACQFGVTGETCTRRCDLVGFANGIPLVVLELKATRKYLEDAFDRTLVDYQKSIPQLFWYNAFSIISNGLESRVGPIGAVWERFGEWKRAAAEEEVPSASLETVMWGTCEKGRLLDLTENFQLFSEAASGLTKLMAKNHQYLGVNAALESLRDFAANQGRLGVYWHAQGSGKGVSMVLFAQKVVRKLPGAWTFLVVTDGEELAEQAYQHFAAAGAVEEAVPHAESAEELRRLLAGRHRYVFAPIQQFHSERPDKQYPLSERFDVVVMASEAHGPPHDPLAANMRSALPNAAFIGFTGTPLLAGEDNTRRVFGDYVSIYNFRESVQDRVTVPLYYESRAPEAQIVAGGLDARLEQLLRDCELDEGQETRLESEFGARYYVITDDDRLDAVARDIVNHFVGRGYQGKAMVVSIDRLTAARMYERVRALWALKLAGMRLQLGSPTEFGGVADLDEHARAERRIAYWEDTDMAVVVSKSLDDIDEFNKKGVDIVPHLERAVKEDLVARFQDAADPLRLVFTCANWISGLDAPTCSTIYLDKPMRGHTLMQTVARANRAFSHKSNGLIVDYLGVFGDPRKVLATYGAGSGGGVAPGDLPVAAKRSLVKGLRKALSEVTESLRSAGFEPEAIRRAPQSPKLRLLDNAVNAVLATEARKQEFLALAGQALLLYRAVIPDPAGEELGAECALFAVMLKRIRSLTPEPGMSALEKRLMRPLEESIEAQGYGLKLSEGSGANTGRTSGVRKLAPGDEGLFGAGAVDLGRIDFETLWKRLARAQKNIETERLRGVIDSRLTEMVRLNPSRFALRQKFEGFLEEFGEGGMEVDALFARLVDLAQELKAEGQRAAQTGLGEEGLALFDALTKPAPGLVEREVEQVGSVVLGLLTDLRARGLEAGWRKDQEIRMSVRLSIEEAVGRLPGPFTPALAAQKADLVFQHVYDSYYGDGRSVYTTV
jgi:type I restriction enzyme R subunit